MIKELSKFIPIAEKVWDRKTTLNILCDICISDGYMRMTDLETTVKMPVKDKRKYTIPIKLLKKVLKSKPGELKVELFKDSKAKIIYDNKSVTFPYQSPDDYPCDPKEEYKEVGVWTRNALLKLYNQIPFTSTDILRSTLMGVYIEQNIKRLSSCATDGHALQFIEKLDPEVENGSPDKVQAILQIKTIQLLAKFAKGDVKVFSGNDYMKFILPGNIELTSRLIEGKYPDFKNIIPAKFPCEVTFKKDDFLKSVKETLPFSNPVNTKAILTINNGNITFCTENIDDDTRFESSIQTTTQKGKGLEIGFDLKLLEKTISGVDDDQVIWKYDDPNTASVFIDANKNGAGKVNLLMPIKIRD